MMNNESKMKFRYSIFNIQYSHKSKSSGFTLVEMIVALGFFTIIMLIVISVLASVAGANEKGRTMRIVIDNLNFAVENMSRTLRVGSQYQCEGVCPSEGGSFVMFRNFQAQTSAEEVWTGFKWEENYAGDGIGAILRSDNCTNGEGLGGGSGWLRITAREIDVNLLKFYVKDSGETDGGQAQIL